MSADTICPPQDVKPAVLRRIEVPVDIRLDRAAPDNPGRHGLDRPHLYEIRVHDIGWGIPDPDWDYGDGPLDARKATLLDVLEDIGAKTLRYIYDFSDDWEHTIRIERIDAAKPHLTYPRLLEAPQHLVSRSHGGALFGRRIAR